MAELIREVPLFEEAAAQLKESGKFRSDLNSEDVSAIMRGVAQSLLSNQDSVRARVLNMTATIARQQGRAEGSIRVENPISATINITCVFANSNQPQRIQLAGLEVREEASFLARMALKTVDIRGKASRALADPNVAFTKALDDQLRPRGATLTGIELHFNETSLSVVLEGGPNVGS